MFFYPRIFCSRRAETPGLRSSQHAILHGGLPDVAHCSVDCNFAHAGNQCCTTTLSRLNIFSAAGTYEAAMKNNRCQSHVYLLSLIMKA
jgi:hypothetical protein